MAAILAVAATDNWNSNGSWVGGVQPTAADDVTIVAGANVTIPTGVTALARSVTVAASGTLTFATTTSTLTIGDGTAGAGNVALSVSGTATITLTGIGTINFVSTSATQQTITTGGKTLPNLVFNGSGGSWQLSSALTIGATSTLTMTNGTLDTNGQTCSWGLFALGVGTKTLTLGASSVTISGNGTTWNAATNGTNFTLNSGTSTITQSNVSGATFAGNGLTYYNVVLTTSNGGTSTISGTNTFNDLTRTTAAGVNAGLVIQGNTIINGVFTVTVTNSATNAARIVVGPTVTGATSQRNITVNGSYSFTNVDFHYINALGTATSPWTGTSIGDAGGNSNITTDASRNLYWVGAASNWLNLARWSLSSGGSSASTAPLPQDNCYIDVNSGVTAGGTFTTSLRYLGKDVDFTGVPNSPAFNIGGFNPGITGSLIWGSGMTITNTGAACTFAMQGGGVLKFNGATYPSNSAASFNIVGVGGTYTLQDDMDLAIGNLTVSAGTFDANGKNVSIAVFSSTGSNTRQTNMGLGTWTLSATGTVWVYSGSNTTLNPSTSTIVISDTSATGKTFAGFSLTYNNLTISGGGTGPVTLSNNSTFNNFTVTGPKTITVNAGLTQTITGTVSLVGSAGNVITLQSGTAGTPFTFSKASGIVSGDYLSIQDSTATGGAAWYAGANSTNVSGNTGWIFTAPPSGTPNLMMMGVG
jgi:hypothetical protein